MDSFETINLIKINYLQHFMHYSIKLIIFCVRHMHCMYIASQKIQYKWTVQQYNWAEQCEYAKYFDRGGID